MPIPKPTPDESRGEFIERCMGDDVMVDEYPNEAQRYAICLLTYAEGQSDEM